MSGTGGGGGIIIRGQKSNGDQQASDTVLTSSQGQTIADSLTAQGHPLLAGIIQSIVTYSET